MGSTARKSQQATGEHGQVPPPQPPPSPAALADLDNSSNSGHYQASGSRPCARYFTCTISSPAWGSSKEGTITPPHNKETGLEELRRAPRSHSWPLMELGFQHGAHSQVPVPQPPCLSGCACICSTLRWGSGKQWVQGTGLGGTGEPRKRNPSLRTVPACCVSRSRHVAGR